MRQKQVALQQKGQSNCDSGQVKLIVNSRHQFARAHTIYKSDDKLSCLRVTFQADWQWIQCLSSADALSYTRHPFFRHNLVSADQAPTPKKRIYQNQQYYIKLFVSIPARVKPKNVVISRLLSATMVEWPKFHIPVEIVLEIFVVNAKKV